MRKKRKIWEGRSGEVLAALSGREEGVRKEPTESGSMEPDQEASERMGRQLFSADGAGMARYERSTVHYRIRHGERAVPPPSAPTPDRTPASAWVVWWTGRAL